MKALALLLLGAAAAAVLPAGPAQAAEKHALIVSVNEYGRPQWKLRGAVNDGRNIRRLLTGAMGYRDDQIRDLFDGAATRDGILNGIRTWLIDGTRPGDEVFFYFSGHGYQAKDLDGDEEDGLDETIVAADADTDGQGGVRNMIIDDELDALFGRLNDRRVTVVIDSCHSGTVTRGAFDDEVEGARSLPPVPGMAAPEPVGTRAVQRHREERAVVAETPGRVVWTAVAPYQKALEEVNATPVSGVFTNRFVRGIMDRAADANRDGTVSNAELHAYVQKESDAYCKSLRVCQAGLTPTLEADPAALATPAPAGGTSPGAAGVPAVLQDTATALLNNDNQGGVQVEILPSSQARVGGTVRFRVTSRTEGSLVLLDANAAGGLVQLFPNEFSQAQNRSNRIHAERPLMVPDDTYGFEFTVEEPSGRGTLIALVLQDPVDITAQLNAHRDLNPIARPVDYLAQIADRLRRPWTQGATTRMTRWSMTSTTYTIER